MWRFRSWATLSREERSACYAADLLLRQYKRARDKRNREKGKFSYKDIKNIYVIVLFREKPCGIPFYGEGISA